MTFEQIFQFLKDNGHNRRELGIAMFGPKRWRNIYRLNIPTDRQKKQIQRAKECAEKITGEKIV